MPSDHADTTTADADTDPSPLVGYDTDHVQTAVQRMYVLETAYREDKGTVPEWITTTRLLLEDLLGRKVVYEYGEDADA